MSGGQNKQKKSSKRRRKLSFSDLWPRWNCVRFVSQLLKVCQQTVGEEPTLHGIQGSVQYTPVKHMFTVYSVESTVHNTYQGQLPTRLRPSLWPLLPLQMKHKKEYWTGFTRLWACSHCTLSDVLLTLWSGLLVILLGSTWCLPMGSPYAIKHKVSLQVLYMHSITS